MDNLKTRFCYYDKKDILYKIYNHPCWLRKYDAVYFDSTDFEVLHVELQIEKNEIRIYLEKI